MRYLYYAGSHVLVGDRTCKAVLRYARALAIAGKSDIVSVPVVTEGGSNAYAHLLIGPASELFSTPVENSASEPVDDQAITDMERLTLELQPSRPAWPQEMTDIADLGGYSDYEYEIELPGDGGPVGEAQKGLSD